jgi:hypothetical protein
VAENVGRRGESWYFRVDLPLGADGRRRQRRVSGFATEREARRALAQAKVDIDSGRLRYGPRRTVADLAAEWLEAVRPNRNVSVQLGWGEGGIHGFPSNRSTRAVMAGTPFLRVVER